MPLIEANIQCVYMRWSYLVTQKIRVTQVIEECVYMSSSNLLILNLCMYAADEQSDPSTTPNLPYVNFPKSWFKMCLFSYTTENNSILQQDLKFP